MLTERTNKGDIIPFEESLKCLLEMPEVWHHVQNSHCATSDEFMFDICDGQYMRTHPLFTMNPRAIQIALNTGDLEIVNPLGSHIKKHKVTIFYYTITNIPPQYRSRLTAIQLLAVAKTKQVRVENGLQKLLHDFITVINMLSSGGLQMQLHNTPHIIEGALVLVPADTLAAHWLEGFKEGVSFAVKNCRNCDTSGNMMATKYLALQCNERNHDTHVDRCAHLDNLSKKTRTYWSKLWGINNASCLLEVKDLPLSQGLVQDPMHLLLEGVVRRELANVLNVGVYIRRTLFHFAVVQHSIDRIFLLLFAHIHETWNTGKDADRWHWQHQTDLISHFDHGACAANCDWFPSSWRWWILDELFEAVTNRSFVHICILLKRDLSAVEDFDCTVSSRLQETVSRGKFHPTDALHVSLTKANDQVWSDSASLVHALWGQTWLLQKKEIQKFQEPSIFSGQAASAPHVLQTGWPLR